MRKNRLLAALGVSAGLLAGGVTAVVFAPGISGAQTETTPPSTAAPAPDGAAPAQPGPRPPRGENCPDKDGAAGGSGATGSSVTPSSGGNAIQLGFRRGGGRA